AKASGGGASSRRGAPRSGDRRRVRVDAARRRAGVTHQYNIPKSRGPKPFALTISSGNLPPREAWRQNLRWLPRRLEPTHELLNGVGLHVAQQSLLLQVACEHLRLVERVGAADHDFPGRHPVDAVLVVQAE